MDRGWRNGTKRAAVLKGIRGERPDRKGGGAEGDRAFGLGFEEVGCCACVGLGGDGLDGGNGRFRSIVDGSIRGQLVLASHWL